MSDLNCTPTASDAAGGEVAAKAYARATLARLLAIGFAEPEADTLALFRRAAFRRGVAEALDLLQLPIPTGAALGGAEAPLSELQATHVRLFGHTVRCLCPPYELEYGHAEVFQQAHALADLAGFYAALGLTVGGPLAERPDHLVAQWEFLALAAMRHGDALTAGAGEGAEVLADMQGKFLADHVGAWMPAFLARVRRHDQGFYAQLAALARALLDRWCAILDIRVGPDWLELRPISADDANIACGAPDLPGSGQVELGPWLAGADAHDPAS